MIGFENEKDEFVLTYIRDGMNHLKNKEYLEAYKLFILASEIYKKKMNDDNTVEYYKQQFITYLNMSASMYLCQYKLDETKNEQYLDDSIQYLIECIELCKNDKVNFDIHYLNNLLCETYFMKNDFISIEKFHLDNILYVKKMYGDNNAIEYAKIYSSQYFNKTLGMEDINIIAFYSRISLLLLIEVYKINSDPNILGYFFDEKILKDANFNETEIKEIMELRKIDEKVTEITMNL